MGCDIHVHQEVKIRGVWLHYAERNFDRDYDLFAKMGYADRSDNVEPIVALRGMPNDATAITLFDYQYQECDAHHPGWLNAVELLELERWQESQGRTKLPRQEGYLFGNSWGAFIEYPDALEKLRRMGLEDVRWIFWFDS